jgi:hypothetical protein
MTPEMHARMQGIDTEAQRRELLLDALQILVPLWIGHVRDWTPEQRCARAHEASGVLAFGENCDELRGRHGSGPASFANGSPAGSGAILNSLAMGIALLALQPGGVDYAGAHWEATPLVGGGGV